LAVKKFVVLAEYCGMKFSKTWITIVLFGIFAAVPYFFPSWERFRIVELRRVAAPFSAWKPGALGRVFLQPHPTAAPTGPTETASTSPAAAAPSNEPLPPSFFTGDYVGKNWPVQEDVKQILQEPADRVAIEDYGCTMNHFYAVLALTEQKQPGAITRICHFGDSPISGDLISGEARTLLQDKFGDSGHGFILISKPWDFYYHEGISMEGKGWKVSSPVLPGSGGSGSYGLGGASFTAGSPSAFSRIRTTKKGEGSEVSRFDIYYRAEPHGGSFLASVDKGEAKEFSTDAANAASAVASISVEDGSHALRITPEGNGPVTLYGVALERNQPGVVYDTLGMLGGTVHHLTRFREDTWIEDLQNRRPDLIILNFGTNESNYGYLPYADYVRNYTVVIQRIRTALPTASILIMAPMDRGARNDDGDIATIPSIPTLVATQRRVARGEGVAFFDTFAAMGGMGTMARWYEDQPRLVTGDFTHPTYTGAQELGTLLVNALLKGFGDYKRTQTTQPCVPPAPPPTVAPNAEASAAGSESAAAGESPVKPHRKKGKRRHHKNG
jgi:lysophospholipase L1-like esterase